MPESLVVPISVVALALALVSLGMAVAAFRSRRPVQRAVPVSASTPPVEVDGHLDQLAQRIEALDESGRRAIQLIGLVRFNPFDDTGSNQSFALAMLDGESSGFVLSSLHSRQQTRVYLKEIIGGRSDVPLSDEETEAIRRAGMHDWSE